MTIDLPAPVHDEIRGWSGQEFIGVKVNLSVVRVEGGHVTRMTIQA